MIGAAPRAVDSYLPRDGAEARRVPDLTGDVEVKYYRLEKLRDESDMSLGKGTTGEVDAPTDVGTGKTSDEEGPLSRIIDVLNDRFGTEFSEEGVQRAHANDYENFRLFMSKKFSDVMADRVVENEELASRFFDDEDFRAVVNSLLSRVVYNEIREGETAA